MIFTANIASHPRTKSLQDSLPKIEEVGKSMLDFKFTGSASSTNLLIAIKGREEKLVATLDDIRRLSDIVDVQPNWTAKLSAPTRAAIYNEQKANLKNTGSHYPVLIGGNLHYLKTEREIPDYVDFLNTCFHFDETFMMKTLVEPDSKVTVKGHVVTYERTMKMKEKITAKEGDILSYVVRVTYDFQQISLSLLANRLRCSNGWVAEESLYTWTGTGHTRLAQLTWANAQTIELMTKSTESANHARLMATTPVENPEEVIQERGRLLHIKQSVIDDVISSFRHEPDATEWGIQNAFSYYATHETPPDERLRYQRIAGGMVTKYELVRGTMSRGIAEKVGARDIESVKK